MLILDGAFAMSLLILADSIFVFAYSIFKLMAYKKNSEECEG